VGRVEDRVADAPLLRKALDASVRPINLVAPGVGAAAAASLLALGLPPLALTAGALSIVTWGALVAWDIATSPGAPAAAAARVPFAAKDVERAHQAIAAAADRVRVAIDRHDGVLTDSLVELLANCDELVDSAARMAGRGDAVYAFLRSHDPVAIERAAEEHLRSARSVRDEAARTSLEAAAEAKRRQLATWQELRNLYDRIVAELISVEATLDELHARVVKLTFEDPGLAVEASQQVGADLKTVRERVRVLEQSAAATLREIS
jgi:hypothetical protein